jgi:cellulose synthase/poly-beta-1,6-N-acetylglucosamine synthase-like glycosyltransferase
LSIFALVFFILSILWPRLGVGVLITGTIGSVLLLIAPLYLYFALPAAISSSGGSSLGGCPCNAGSIPVNSFFGSYTQNYFFGPTTYSWGGGTGWFMAFVAFAFSLASTLVAFSAARRILPLGNVRVSTTPAALL